MQRWHRTLRCVGIDFISPNYVAAANVSIWADMHVSIRYQGICAFWAGIVKVEKNRWMDRCIGEIRPWPRERRSSDKVKSSILVPLTAGLHINFPCNFRQRLEITFPSTT